MDAGGSTLLIVHTRYDPHLILAQTLFFGVRELEKRFAQSLALG